MQVLARPDVDPVATQEWVDSLRPAPRHQGARAATSPESQGRSPAVVEGLVDDDRAPIAVTRALLGMRTGAELGEAA
jgi:hypothetical protein